jgi:HAD superfamily hydrolase (TIGR01509 family)
MLKVLLWDVDGTLAETERDGHRVAFNQAFEAMQVPWRWDERRYGELLAVTGGCERLLHDMQGQALAPADENERLALAGSLHRLKNEHYASIVEGKGIALRDGVLELMDDCLHDGILMGIVTTTSRANVQALLAAHLGAEWQSRFSVVICGEDAPLKKPQPQAYRMALQALALSPGHALAIEDSPAGVSAARAAGVEVVVTRSHYFAEPAVPGALAVGPSLATAEGWTPEPAVRAHAVREVAKPDSRVRSPAPGASPVRVSLDQLRRWHQGPSSGEGAP